jgi:hypothetical protein
MTPESPSLTTLVLADDAEFFRLLRTAEDTACSRCRTDETARAGVIWTDKGRGRREQRTCECGWSWSVPVDGGDRL